jgi:hypothetical protein
VQTESNQITNSTRIKTMSSNNTQLPANKEMILEKHCPSMSLLYLDDNGRAFRKRILAAMEDFTDKVLHADRNQAQAKLTATETEWALKVIDLQKKGDMMALALRRLRSSVMAHPDCDGLPHSEWGGYVAGADEALMDWMEGAKLTPGQIADRKAAIEWYRNPAGVPVETNDAVEFANWLSDYYEQYGTGYWKELPDGDEQSTEQLYEQFKKGKEVKP